MHFVKEENKLVISRTNQSVQQWEKRQLAVLLAQRAKGMGQDDLVQCIGERLLQAGLAGTPWYSQHLDKSHYIAVMAKAWASDVNRIDN